MKPTTGPPAPIGAGVPDPPLVSRGRKERWREGEGGDANSPGDPSRHPHMGWELRMLGQNGAPPLLKRVRRQTRGMEAGDNSCELTRKSDMICPTTCGCWISLQDIMGKPHLVSHTLRA